MNHAKFFCSVVVFAGLSFIAALSGFAQDAVKTPDKVYFFQMGHEKAPFFQDAIHITQNSLYNDKTGYGWLHKGTRGEGAENLVARLGKPGRPPIPDSIAGYCVFWRGGDPLIFRVDIPDGEYKIWIYSGMCSDRFFDVTPFEVSAGSSNKTGNAEALKNFRERYFEGIQDSYEYTPEWTEKTIWEKYVRQQSVSIYGLEGKSVNGQLDIQFQMPLQIVTPAKLYGVLPINAMVICPISKTEEGKKKIEEIAARRCAEYLGHVKLIKEKTDEKMPEITDEFKTSGYVPFVRDFMKPVYAESVPGESEIGKNLSMFMTQGQREILSFAIHPLKDVKNVKVEISELKDDKGNILARDCVKLHWMRYMIQPVDYQHRTAEYRGVPLLMMDYKPLNYRKGMNRQYILAVTTPENAVPGVYKGNVAIVPEGEKSMSLNLEIKVYPFKLETYPDDDERIWLYYGDMGYKTYGELLMTEDERWKLLDKDLAFMKQQLIATTVLFDYKATDEDLDKFMELYKKYNFRRHGVFGDYAMLRLLENYCRGKSKNKDISPFIKKIKEVLARKKEKGWPDMAFYTFAEIHEGMPGYLLAKEMIAQIKKEVPEAVLITLPSAIQEAEAMVTTEADIVGPNAVSMTESMVEKIHKAGKKLWFYGWGRQRFRCGLVDWRLGNRGAIKEWYSISLEAHFNPIDGTGFDCWNDSPPFIGPNGPISTLGMEETTEGRLDFFYLATLEKWIEKANALKTPLALKASAHGQTIINDLKARIVPDYSYYNQRLKGTDIKNNRFNVNLDDVFKWKNEEYNIYRKKIAEAITAIQDALKGIDSVPAEESALLKKQAVKESARFDMDSSGAMRLTDDEFTDSRPSYSPDGKFVSYVSKRNGKERIVIIDPEHKKERILPVESAQNTFFSWASASDKIAYTSDGNVSIINLRDDKVSRIGAGGNPVFSPDGKKMAYFTRKDVMLYDLESGKLSNLSNQAVAGAMERLSWSPDGKTIYYSKDGSLWSALADGSENKSILRRTSLGFSPAPAIESPIVSSDGKKIYVTINSDGLFAHVSNNQLGVYDLDSGEFKIMADADSWALSPDGKKLIYSIGGDLMMCDTASGNKSEFAPGDSPAFSPAGDRIVYLHRTSLLQEPDVWIKMIK